MTQPPQTTQKRLVYLGADHGGFELKKQIKAWLDEWKVGYQDLGAAELNPTDDYPDFALSVAQKVAESPDANVGILVCRSGGGMAVVANKVSSVRAVPAYEPKQAVHARTNDHANVITLAGDWMTTAQAKAIVQAFLETEPDQSERHRRRIAKITDYEEKL